MGWLLPSIVLLILLALIGYVYAHRRKGSNQQSDSALDQRIKEECRVNTRYVGQFDIDLSELSNTDWVNLNDRNLTPEDFSYVVKWRNYGNQYSYRIIATSNNETDGITLSSEKVTAKSS